ALHHETQILLGRIRIFRVLEYKHRGERIEFGGYSRRTYRHVYVVNIVRELAHGFVRGSLGNVVHRDSVQGKADVSGQECLVVVRIEPGQRPGDESLIQRAGILEGRGGFLRVDDDLVARVREPAAERPQ